MLTVGLFTIGLSPTFAELANGIVSVVDEAVITFNEVNDRSADSIRTYVSQNHVQPVVLEEKVNKIRNETLQELEDRQLILHEFKTAGYALPESVLDDLVQEKIRTKFRDRATLAKMLQHEGLTFEKFRQQIREQFIVEQLRYKNINQEIIISPHKVENYYEAHKEDFKIKDEVRLRLIVLNKASAQNEEESRKLAEEILAKLNEGRSFTEMADMYSQTKQRNQGGDRGWEELSELRPELAEAAAKLKPGEHSGVIDTSDAFYLLLVEDKRPTHFKPLNDVRAEIEKNLRDDEQKRLNNQWMDRLRKKTFVKRTFY